MWLVLLETAFPLARAGVVSESAVPGGLKVRVAVAIDVIASSWSKKLGSLYKSEVRNVY